LEARLTDLRIEDLLGCFFETRNHLSGCDVRNYKARMIQGMMDFVYGTVWLQVSCGSRETSSAGRNLDAGYFDVPAKFKQLSNCCVVFTYWKALP